MIKFFRKKLIIALIATVATITVIGISTKTIFNLRNAQTKKAQALNIKEKTTTDVLVDDKEKSKEENSAVVAVAEIVDTENTNNNNNTENNQEIINHQVEKQNNNQTTNPKSNNLPSENSSNNSETIKQEINNYQIENSNNNEQTTNVQQVSENNNVNTMPEAKPQTIQYDRTTTIYANDNITLLRVEYYSNNKLTYYSVVEQFDATTKSYIEKIYKCNLELVRTDVYKNGNLINSY